MPTVSCLALLTSLAGRPGRSVSVSAWLNLSTGFVHLDFFFPSPQLCTKSDRNNRYHPHEIYPTGIRDTIPRVPFLSPSLRPPSRPPRRPETAKPSNPRLLIPTQPRTHAGGASQPILRCASLFSRLPHNRESAIRRRECAANERPQRATFDFDGASIGAV